MFVHIESQNEHKIRNKMDFERKKCIFDLWNYTITNNIVYPDRWKRMAFERIMLLEETIIKAVQKDGYSIIDVEQWSFSSALLYSVTVITTIGKILILFLNIL